MHRNFMAYYYAYKTQILRSLAYKFDVYGNIIMQTIIMFATSFFWKALFVGKDTIAGVDVETMLTYTVVSSMIGVMLTTNVEWRIMKSVQKGTVAIDMMRPVHVFSLYFAEDLGNITALIFQNLLPIFVVGSLLIKLPKPKNAIDFCLFMASLVLAFFINWYLAVLFGMWAFAVVDISALLQVKKHLIRLLSGSMIPIWFFPDWARNILEVLPFVYLYQLPLDIFIGKYTRESLIKGFLVQILWLVVLKLFFEFISRRITKKLMVQGG